MLANIFLIDEIFCLIDCESHTYKINMKYHVILPFYLHVYSLYYTV